MLIADLLFAIYYVTTGLHLSDLEEMASDIYFLL